MKTALGHAKFGTEETVVATVTEVELTGLEPDTAYLVRVVSHRKNSEKEGLSDMFEFTTLKGTDETNIRYCMVDVIIVVINDI